MSGIGHALVNLFTVSTVLYWDQRENTAHLGLYSTVETNKGKLYLKIGHY